MVCLARESLCSLTLGMVRLDCLRTQAGYGDFRGEERFRAALAGMMETTFVHAPVDKDAVLVQAGCSHSLGGVGSRENVAGLKISKSGEILLMGSGPERGRVPRQWRDRSQ